MIDMQEELQIIQGARLSGTQAPERLETRRAAAFVSKVIQEAEAGYKPKHGRDPMRKVLQWTGIVLSIAAVFALVFWLSVFSPRPETGGKGTPALLQENQDTHAVSASLDSLAPEQDSLELSVRNIVK